MTFLLLTLLVLLNIAISWINAVYAGKMWVESKALGGWPRVMAWSAAIQSASGFTVIYAIFLAMVAVAAHILSPSEAAALGGIVYLLIIMPILGTGLLIVVHSWIQAFRDRTLLSLGVASWNSLAEIHNIASATDGGIYSAFGSITNYFDKEGEDNAPVSALIMVMVLAAFAGGVLTTRSIMNRNFASVRLPER